MRQAYNSRSTAALVTSPCPSPDAAIGGRARMAVYKPIPSLSLQQQESFWARITVDMVDSDECFCWTGKLDADGYGRCRFAGHGDFLAHRVAYTILRGPIAEGLTLDHLCRNRKCCNPAHLEPVTAVENLRRSDSPIASNFDRTHCRRGHEFTPENTRVRRGKRECRACVRASLRVQWKNGLRHRGRNG